MGWDSNNGRIVALYCVNWQSWLVMVVVVVVWCVDDSVSSAFVMSALLNQHKFVDKRVYR